MKKTYFISIAKIKRLSAVCFSFCLVAFLFTSVLVKPDGLLPALSKADAIYKVDTGNKAAALTFNISWGNRVPGPVLDTLKKQGVKATFFVSGSWAKNYPELARRITAEGHEIASSGDRQVNLTGESRSTVKEELARSREYIKEATGNTVTLLRTPFGEWNNTVLAAAAESGYTVVQWSVDSLDIETPGKNNIVKNVMQKVHPGAIILMHASDTASETPGSLPSIIEGLKAEGYEFMTVSSLLKLGPGAAD